MGALYFVPEKDNLTQRVFLLSHYSDDAIVPNLLEGKRILWPFLKVPLAHFILVPLFDP